MPDKDTQVVRVNWYRWEGLGYTDAIKIKRRDAPVQNRALGPGIRT